MRRSAPGLAAVTVFMLLMAACGGGTGTDTTTSDTTGATTGATAGSTTTSTTTTTTTTTMPEPMAAELNLTVAAPSEDPLETIEPLEGVSVSMNADGAYVFTFDENKYGGLSVRLLGLPEGDYATCSWYAEADFAGEGEGTGCFSQTQADGYFGDDPYSNGDAATMSIVMMLEVTADSISLTIGDTNFTGTGLSLGDGPLFVQIDPNTGGLAEPVTRRIGEITASELFAALGG